MKKREEISGHEDGRGVGSPPVNLVIVGCKYDLF